MAEYTPSNDFFFDTAVDGPYTPSNDFDFTVFGELSIPPDAKAFRIDAALVVSRAFILDAQLSVDRAFEITSVFQVSRPFEIDAEMSEIVNKEFKIDAELGAFEFVNAPFQLDADLVVSKAFEIRTDLDETVNRAFEIDAHLTELVNREFQIDAELLDFDPVSRAFEIVSSLDDQTSAVFTTAVFVTLNGNTIEPANGDVRADEDTSFWEVNLELGSEQDYIQFKIDDPFQVTILGEVYEFIVSGRRKSRQPLEESAPTFQVSGVSPGIAFSPPRDDGVTISQTATISAQTLVGDLLPGATVNWNVSDWIIPGGRLDVESGDRIKVVQDIVGAVKGLLESEKNGDFRVRYKFPDSVPDYPTAVPSHIYATDVDLFSIAEVEQLNEFANRLDISDVLIGDFSDTLIFVPDPDIPNSGKIRVFPTPFDESVVLDHTADATISLTLDGTVFESLTEIIEIKNGVGNVSSPVFSIDSFNYLNVNLGAVTADLDSSTVNTVTPEYSLVEITYTTRFIQYSVSSFMDREAQFILRRC